MKSFQAFNEAEDKPKERKEIRLPGGVVFNVNDAKLFRQIVAVSKKDKEGYVPGANKNELKSILKMEKIGLVKVNRGQIVRGHNFKQYNWGRHWKMVDTEHVPIHVLPVENYKEKINQILAKS
jgi:hypothetical protein